MKSKTLRTTILLAALAGLGLGGGVYQKTREGNELWAQKKYQDAFSKYMEASSQAKGPAEALLHYNMGGALYKQERYDEAVKEFEQAQSSADPGLKQKAYYNSGNCYFRSGIAAKDVELLKKAAAGYQKALEIDPGDQDAKHNLEVVRRHIQLQKENPPPQQQQCPNPQQGQEQKKDQKQQSGQDQQKQDQQKQDRQNQGQGAQPQPSGEPQELSKEEAERILKSLSEQEKEQLKELMKAQGQSQGMGKDW